MFEVMSNYQAFDSSGTRTEGKGGQYIDSSKGWVCH